MAGRMSGMSDPNKVEQLATLYVAGQSNHQIASEMGVDRATIVRWKQDARFKAASYRLHKERTVAITRKIDAELDRRLDKAGEMDARDLVAIRKEYLGTVPNRTGANADSAKIAQELWAAQDEELPDESQDPLLTDYL